MSIIAWWYKTGRGKSSPWAKFSPDGDQILDYNEKFIEKVTAFLGEEVCSGLTTEKVLELYLDPIATQKRVESLREPQADLSYDSQTGKLKVKSYNAAFVKKLRSSLGDLVDDSMKDDEVVQLYIDRENIEREEPRLEIVHTRIDAEGKIRVEYNWNKAFIDLLKKNGITGEDEGDEVLVQTYLALTRPINDPHPSLLDPSLFDEDTLREAFSDLDQETQRELKEAETQIKKLKRKKK